MKQKGMQMNKPTHKLVRNISVNCLARRKELGLGLLELHRISGVNPGVISLIERGKRGDVRISTLEKLAKGLDCDVCNLLYGF